MVKKKRPRGDGGRGEFTMEKLRRVASPRTIENGAKMSGAEFIVKRYVEGNEISCIFVNEPEYIFCSVRATPYTLQELCSCGAGYFCSHAAALVLTWLEYGETFLDLDAYLEDLEHKSKEELVSMLRTLIARYPSLSLEALGEPGFLPGEVLELDDPDQDWEGRLFDRDFEAYELERGKPDSVISELLDDNDEPDDPEAGGASGSFHMN